MRPQDFLGLWRNRNKMRLSVEIIKQKCISKNINKIMLIIYLNTGFSQEMFMFYIPYLLHTHTLANYYRRSTSPAYHS